MLQYVKSTDCKRAQLLAHFGEVLHDGKVQVLNCCNCSSCKDDTVGHDRTTESRMIFTTIAETHSELGKEKVVLVLMGSNAQAMTPELKRVSTYGKGKSMHPKTFWNELHHLLQPEWIKPVRAQTSYGAYVQFELTEKADGLLAGTSDERVVFDVAITQQ